MRPFLLLSLAALLATANALAAPADAASELADSALLHIAAAPPPPTPARRMTNAERLARGLPPAAPQHRGTPVRRQGGASPLPSVTYRGTIAVRATGDHSLLGYVAKTPVGYAQYGYSGSTAALIVNFALPVGETSGSQLNFHTENSAVQGFSLLGLVQGFDNTGADVHAGSYNYGYFAGTAATAPGAPAAFVANSYTVARGKSLAAESATWTVDTVTGTLAPQWVNTDGSVPPISFWIQGVALYFGGDADAFAARYPTGITRIYFQFVPI